MAPAGGPIVSRLHRSALQLALLIIAALVLVAPFHVSALTRRVLTAIFFGVTLGASYNIIGGFAGFPSFGQSVFLGTSAYTTAILMHRYNVTFYPAWVAGVFVSIAVAALLGVPLLRLRGHYFAVGTIMIQFGLAEIVSAVPFLEGGRGWTFTTGYGYNVFYYFFLAMAVLAVFSTWIVRRSRFGFGLLAISRNEMQAQVLGVPTAAYKLAAFVLSAFWVAVLGPMYGRYLAYIDTTVVFSPRISINMLLYALIGGMGFVGGPVIGAVIVETVNNYVWARFLEIHLIVYGMMLIFFILFLPRGILGSLRSLPSILALRKPGYKPSAERSGKCDR